ncbi:YwpF family protein [Virgibacillus sp. YIM 98842]|uniref:YwpF family protein n=1 Tax=Virgibacillus sp. YIM 98842 TaxID=2663533 RepID=UPI0013DC8920|nr:YwpF family protein [Virgibacillus sp. YIM 98842]
MKTFKLKSLEVFDQKEEEIMQHNIPLLDGLIINREDDQDQWTIEAFIDKSHLSFFEKLKEEAEEIMLQVKITKESNEPATFITSIMGINEIGENMNILFVGTIVDRRINKIEEMLTSLIEKGYQGNDLLEKFKDLIS